MSAVTIPPQKTQLFWSQKGHSTDFLLLFYREHHYFLNNLLVPLHQPSEQKPPAENGLSVCYDHWTVC